MAFMTDNKGKLNYQAMGKTVYASLDSSHDENPGKTKSIRKMVRAIIEQEGRPGWEVKAQMKDTSYSMGRVYFKRERVAEWDEGAGVLVLKGSGKDREQKFKILMGQE